MLKKIGIGIGIFIAVLFVVGYICLKMGETSHEDKIRKATEKMVQQEKKDIDIITRINIVKPDVGIEKAGVSIIKEKPVGLPAQPECYRIVKTLLQKTIKSINCMNGFVIFNSEETMSGIEVMLAVNNYNGADYYSLADEKGNVKFNYVPVEGDLNGQTRSTVKIFAVGSINDSKEYVILECPNVLAYKKIDGVRTICLAPVIAGLKSQEATRKVLEEQFFVSEAGLQILLPQNTLQVSQR